MEEFKKAEFIILDVETTGLSPAYGDRVIEVAALKVQGLQVIDRFHSLIDPERPLSYGAFLVNGITPQMLQGAPRAAEILPKFFEFCRGNHRSGQPSCLVGHNIRFDLGFLSHEAQRVNHRWEQNQPALDTLRLAKWLLPDLRHRRLQALAYHLGIEDVQQHRAMGDVEMTFAVFRQFLDMAFRRGESELAQLLERGCAAKSLGKISSSRKQPRD